MAFPKESDKDIPAGFKRSENSERMEIFERQITGEVPVESDDKVHERVRKVINSALDMLVIEHINTALYSELSTARVTALKLLYEIVGLTGPAAKNVEKPQVEKTIQDYMTALEKEAENYRSGKMPQ